MLCHAALHFATRNMQVAARGQGKYMQKFIANSVMHPLTQD